MQRKQRTTGSLKNKFYIVEGHLEVWLKMKKDSNYKGSITVEMVFILPVVLLVFFSMISFYRFLEIDEVLRFAASKTGEELTISGLLSSVFQEKKEKINTDKIIDTITESVFIRAKVLQNVPDGFLEDRWIVGGKEGIHFWNSHIQKEDRIVIWMRYQMYFPVFKKILPKISVVRKIVLRSFTGSSLENEKQEEISKEETSKEGIFVYITETGDVYHETKECSHIKLSIETVDFESIFSRRNESGAKYTFCERCKIPLNKQGVVFITLYGNHYHTDISCSGLKRTVRTISLEQAQNEGKRKCKKCEERQKKEATKRKEVKNEGNVNRRSSYSSCPSNYVLYL